MILYRHVPVMAMVRLPTIDSQGRANLHQGAAAAAVHLVTGRTFGGVCKNRPISRHPDTGELIAGFEIPGWKDLLTAAMKLSDAIEMGYIGVDFVVDAASRASRTRSQCPARVGDPSRPPRRPAAAPAADRIAPPRRHPRRTPLGHHPADRRCGCRAAGCSRVLTSG